MKAIVSVIGKDKKGIIAGVSGLLSDMDVNIEDISQTILQDYFTMIMAVELKESKLSFTQISDKLSELGTKIGVEIKMQSQQIFDAMHKIAMVGNN
ncbi:MAG: ACT domain-containing protein [Clostridia bacterium]|nr:ACT domain-containing protein [Clostridia bacterium]